MVAGGMRERRIGGRWGGFRKRQGEMNPKGTKQNRREEEEEQVNR